VCRCRSRESRIRKQTKDDEKVQVWLCIWGTVHRHSSFYFFVIAFSYRCGSRNTAHKTHTHANLPRLCQDLLYQVEPVCDASRTPGYSLASHLPAQSRPIERQERGDSPDMCQQSPCSGWGIRPTRPAATRESHQAGVYCTVHRMASTVIVFSVSISSVIDHRDHLCRAFLLNGAGSREYMTGIASLCDGVYELSYCINCSPFIARFQHAGPVEWCQDTTRSCLG
jgi:hypothetical protein